MVNITSELKGNVGEMLEIECSVFVVNDDGSVTYDDQSNIAIRRGVTVIMSTRLTSNVVTTKKTYTLRDLMKEDAGGPIVCAVAEHMSAEVTIQICCEPSQSY